VKRWPLIVDPAPAAGAWNMAADEFLFSSLSDNPHTTVRFYRWARPTASLGYSQDLDRVADAAYCRANGIDIVRRITGGKLVLHHREVTYAVCSSDTEAFTETLTDSYRLISRGLMQGLARLGIRASLAGPPPPEYVRGTLPCFSHPGLDEVECEGKKIIGSAQKREGRKFLQHGSIPLEGDEPLLRAVSLQDRAPGGLRLGSLSEAAGRPVDFDSAVKEFAAGLGDFFGVELAPRSFSPEEEAVIRRIELGRYADRGWTLRREPGPAVAF